MMLHAKVRQDGAPCGRPMASDTARELLCGGLAGAVGVFVGQPAFKQMGAWSGYMLGSGAVALLVGCAPVVMAGATAAFPLAAGAGGPEPPRCRY